MVVPLSVAVMSQGGRQIWGLFLRESRRNLLTEKECGREVKGESRRAALASVTRSLRLLMSILNTFPCLPSGLRQVPEKRDPPLPQGHFPLERVGKGKPQNAQCCAH